jgi:hypothetical protein
MASLSTVGANYRKLHRFSAYISADGNFGQKDEPIMNRRFAAQIIDETSAVALTPDTGY